MFKIKYSVNKNYISYFTIISLYFLAIGLQGVYIPWLLLDITGSGVSMGIMLLIRSIPGILTSGIAGKLCDSYSKKNIMFLVCLLQAIVIIIFATNFKISSSIVGIYILVLLFSLGNTFFFSAAKSWLHVNANESNLFKVNANYETASQVSYMLGTASGGFIWSYLKNEFFVIMLLIFIFCSLFCYLLLSTKNEVNKEKINKNIQSKIQIKKYWYFFALLFIPIFFVQITNITLGPLVKLEAKLTSEAFGLISSSFSAGAIIASLCILYLKKFFQLKTLTLISVVLLCLNLIALGNMKTIYTLSLCTFLFGILLVLARTCSNSLLMSSISSDAAGQLQSVLLKVQYFSILFAALSVTFSAERFGYGFVIAASGGITFIFLGAIIFIFNRNMNKELKEETLLP